MIVVPLLLKAMIAILAVMMLWPKSPPHLKKVLIVLIAAAYMLTAILESVQSGRVVRESAKTNVIENEMRNDLSILKTNSEEDREAKLAETKRRQDIVGSISRLTVEGLHVRDTCGGNDPDASEKRWMADVEIYLNTISRSDAREFLNSSEIIPQQSCFLRIQAHIAVLEQIKHRYA